MPIAQPPYIPYDHYTTKSSQETSQTSTKKRRQSILTEVTNYPQWTPASVAPVISSLPMEGVISASPSMIAASRLQGQTPMPYANPAHQQSKEVKRVRFDNPISTSQGEEEELEYSDCMQRRLEHEVYYPYYPGYANQGGMVMAPPMPIPGIYQSQAANVRWSGVPVWVPGMPMQGTYPMTPMHAPVRC